MFSLLFQAAFGLHCGFFYIKSYILSFCGTTRSLEVQQELPLAVES